MPRWGVTSGCWVASTTVASNSARCARPSPSIPRRCVAPAGLCRVLRKKGFASCRVGPPLAHNPQCSPFFPQDSQLGNYGYEHAGVLIFAALLGAISKVSGNTQDILAQWLAALGLGAAHIEQTNRDSGPQFWILSYYCRSYSPLLTLFKTVKPAFLASLIDKGLVCCGVLNSLMILRIGFRQAGHALSSGADRGRFRVNLPPHAAQLPSQSSYS